MDGQYQEIEVILNIFSGRPNPRWVINPGSFDVLRNKIVSLSLSKPMKNPNLGYRGFRLINKDGVNGIPHEIRVFDGTIAVVEKAETKYMADEKGLEEWLLNQARGYGYGKLLDRFLKYVPETSHSWKIYHKASH